MIARPRSIRILVLALVLGAGLLGCKQADPLFCGDLDQPSSDANPLNRCQPAEYCAVNITNSCGARATCDDASICHREGVARTDTFCVMNADTRSATCESACTQDVQCGALSAALPLCQAGACVQCRAGADCDSRLCNTDNTCVAAAAVAYAAHDGTGDACTLAAPCSLTTALTKVSPTVTYIKLAASSLPHYQGPYSFGNQHVTLIGELDSNGKPTAIIRDTNANDTAALIDLPGSGFNVTFDGVAFNNADSTQINGAVNVQCLGSGVLHLHRSEISNSDGLGIRSGAGCSLSVNASSIVRNDGGGLDIAGPFSITNSVIAFNGTLNTSPVGGVKIDVGNGTGPRMFAHNTVFENLSLAIKPGGVSCASSMPAQLANNIVYQNQPASQATAEGSCNYSFIGGDFAIGTNHVTAAPTFVNSISSSFDLHLTAALPSQGTPLTNVTSDMDGDIRSSTAPDIGADERN